MLVLFDLDGTLLSTRGAGMEAVLEACRALFGFEFRHSATRVDGNLDPLIWRGLCAENGIANAEELHARFRAEYAARLAVKLREPGRTQRFVGTRELVDALEPESLGLLTGNYPETGRAKLDAAGFDPNRFEVAAWGSDAESRPELVPIAVARDRERRMRELAPHEIVVIGDTPFDVRCAKANGVRSIAVATGRYGLDELRSEGADLVLEDLADTHSILEWMLEDSPR